MKFHDSSIDNVTYAPVGFKKLCDSLAKNQVERLDRLKAIPRRLPDPIWQPKVTFIPGRKRALTGREAADLQEKDEARRRRRAQIEAENQAQNDVRQEQDTMVRSQYQEEVAEAYLQSKPGKSPVVIYCEMHTNS